VKKEGQGARRAMAPAATPLMIGQSSLVRWFLAPKKKQGHVEGEGYTAGLTERFVTSAGAPRWTDDVTSQDEDK
jgi:hypothetical protein